MTTVATTDLQLLLPNSTVTLPALGIQLPLIGFFLVTPWLVLILHFNLLQNLDSHANKLVQWANTFPNQMPPRAALPAFLFDFALLEQGGAFSRFTPIAAQVAFYAAGPMTVAILLWRFSDYQSWAYTFSQAIAFFISFAIVVTSTMALSAKHRLKVAFSYFNYWFIYMPIFGIVLLQAYWVGWLSIKTSKPFLFSENFYEFLIPRINIPASTPLVSLPNDLNSRMAIDFEKDASEWWRKHASGSNFENANLKYAQLPYADLRKANLQRANLQGANLKGTKLYGADLSFANLDGADLTNANLEHVYLMKTKLNSIKAQDTYWFKASFIDSELGSAELQNANFTEISVDSATTFLGSFTDSTTLIIKQNYATDDKGQTRALGIFGESTFILRDSLRDINKLILPNISYNQLFPTPTSHTFFNDHGKAEQITGVGLRQQFGSVRKVKPKTKVIKY